MEDIFQLDYPYDSEKILRELETRFKDGQQYTNIGRNNIVFVNSYVDVDARVIAKAYINYKNNNNKEQLPSHIFSLAQNVFEDIQAVGKDHCIVLMGESGSGKSETKKSIVKFISNTASVRKGCEKLREKMLNSMVVLESFCNAKMPGNANSSRMAQLLDIQFDFDGHIGVYYIYYFYFRHLV